VIQLIKGADRIGIPIAGIYVRRQPPQSEASPPDPYVWLRVAAMVLGA
jgi:hypothetical protein